MRVLVNALPLRYGGGVTHLENELTALARVDPALELHTVVSPWTEVSALPGTVEVVPIKSVAHRFAYEQLRLRSRHADLLYCPANFAPLSAKVPIVLTIQNANYYRAGLCQPETKASRSMWKVKANHFAMRRAAAIIAVSQSLADDASLTVRGVRSKMHVIHHGAPQWPSITRPVTGLPEAYVLSVAGGAPHKHVNDVVAGWALARDLSEVPVSLVLVGSFADSQVEHHRAIAGRHSGDLLHLGVIQERAALCWVYSHARAMVLMSTLESFSLTPVEAGSVGCPLVLSDIPVHREIVRDNAWFVARRNVPLLAETLAVHGFNAAPGSRRWQWSTSWDDHAREVSGLFRSQIHSLSARPS